MSSNRSLFPSFILIFLLSHAVLAGPRESGAGELQATWMDNSNNEEGFKIERRTGTTQTYTQIAIVAANITSYNDSGLVDGETYCYRVLAFNPAGSVTTTINANATPTFGIFIQGTGNVSFNPVANRIFVRFRDSGAVTRGSTSVAVRTQ